MLWAGDYFPRSPTRAQIACCPREGALRRPRTRKGSAQSGRPSRATKLWLRRLQFSTRRMTVGQARQIEDESGLSAAPPIAPECRTGLPAVRATCIESPTLAGCPDRVRPRPRSRSVRCPSAQAATTVRGNAARPSSSMVARSATNLASWAGSRWRFGCFISKRSDAWSAAGYSGNRIIHNLSARSHAQNEIVPYCRSAYARTRGHGISGTACHRL
jgi:hypothetical protein